MERNFMGLTSKDSLASVKQEIPDQGPETQWSFNKNASSTADAFDHDRKTSVDEFKKSPLSLSYGENYGIPTPITRPQFLGVPMTMTSPVNPIVGLVNPGNNNNNKPLAGPAQMTIFYAGTVRVYDEISPEMAQAIMLLAGTGSSLASNMTPAKASSSPAEVAVLPNQPLSSQPGPSLKNELDFSSTRKDDDVVTKTTGIISSPVCNQVPQRVVFSRGPIHLPVLIPSAIPQSRRASLARFFERRKERVMSVGPYNCDKKPQEGIAQGNNS